VSYIEFKMYGAMMKKKKWMRHVSFCIVSNRQAFTNFRIFFLLLKHSFATATVGMPTLKKV